MEVIKKLNSAPPPGIELDAKGMQAYEYLSGELLSRGDLRQTDLLEIEKYASETQEYFELRKEIKQVEKVGSIDMRSTRETEKLKKMMSEALKNANTIYKNFQKRLERKKVAAKADPFAKSA